MSLTDLKSAYWLKVEERMPICEIKVETYSTNSDICPPLTEISQPLPNLRVVELGELRMTEYLGSVSS